MTNNEENTRNNDHPEINRKRKNNGSNNNNSPDYLISKKIKKNRNGAVDDDYGNNNNNTSPDYQISKKINRNHDAAVDDDNDMLALSLSLYSKRSLRVIQEQPQPPQRQTSPPPSLASQQEPSPSPSPSPALLQRPLELSPTHAIYSAPSFMPEQLAYRQEPILAAAHARPLRLRRNPTQTPGEGKSDTVPAPFPWATTHRATVYSLNYLISQNMTSITGEVQCKKCERQYEMAYDLRTKFVEVGRFIAENKSSMHERAPNVWMTPMLPTCTFCEQENSAKPVVSMKKRQINWLFLLLGQLLGCCTLDQLKYFCKHTKNHRTGAKDRVLFLTYLGLCKQLDPSGPFDR